MKNRCNVCFEKSAEDLCKRCAASYDRWHRSKKNDGTTWAVIEWAAARARKLALENAARKLSRCVTHFCKKCDVPLEYEVVHGQRLYRDLSGFLSGVRMYKTRCPKCRQTGEVLE